MNRPIEGNAKKRLFLEDVKAGRVPPLAAEIPYCDAHLLYRSIVRSRGSADRSVLFESLKGNDKIAVHSIIAFDPYMEFRVKDGEVRTISLPGGRETVSFRDPLDRLSELLTAYPQKPSPDLPPFQGGAIGMISYDFVRYIEDIPANSLDDLGTPDAHFLLVDKVIAFDHMQ
ncbi:MAG TPA: hypothetical protein VN260_07910, partial [Dissulfurispiraceae bacterium]|nr:hypothetical protein [Dissulfurispiraceae bacterium]